MLGIGDKLSAMFGGSGVLPIASPQQQVGNLANAGFPGAQQMQQQGGAASTPALAGPSSAFQTAYLNLIAQGVDPSTAAILAQQQTSQQGPSTASTAAAGLGDVGLEVLQVKLRPELGELPHPVPIGVTAPRGLELQGQPGPNPAITTASIIAELV